MTTHEKDGRRPSAGSRSGRDPGGLRLLAPLVGMALVLVGATVEPPPGVPAVACEPGTQLAVFPGTDRRVNAMAFHRGHVIENEHGSGKTRVWDISDPRAPRLVRSYDEGWSGHHLYIGVGEVLSWNWAGRSQIDLSRTPDLAPAAGRQFVEPMDPERLVYFPLSFGGVPRSYGYVPSGRLTVHDERLGGRQTSRIEPLDDLGFEGRPLVIGNLLIIRGDNEQPEGVAVYDISDPYAPTLLDRIRHTADGQPLGKAYDAMPVWRHYVVLAQSDDTKAAGGGGRAVDFVDFSNPRQLRHVARRVDYSGNIRYAQFKDEFMFVGDAKVDLSAPGFPQVAHFPDGGGEYNLPVGHLLITAGQGRPDTMRLWCNDAKPDTRPPTVGFHDPPAGATGVNVRARVGLVIHETLDPSTLIPANFVLKADGDEEPVPVDVSWTDHDVLNVTPRQPLAPDTRYVFEMPAGGVRDVAGNGLAEAVRFDFTTGHRTNAAPRVELELSADRIEPGRTVTATVRASDPEGQPVAVRIDWGDGRAVRVAGGRAKRVYRAPGVHRISASARDADGAVGTRTRLLLVDAERPPTGAASSSVAIDPTSGAVWVAQPDHGRVTRLGPPGPAFEALTAPTAGSSGGGPATGTFQIVNVRSGLCVTADAGEGRQVTQRPCRSSGDQRWRMSRQGDGAWSIETRASGSPLAPHGTSTGPGATWQVREQRSGAFSLRPSTDLGVCLDVENGALEAGAPLRLHPCAGEHAAQHFELRPAGAVRATPVGADPRSVAVDCDGAAWVSSRMEGAVVVVQPDGHVSARIDLGRGSEPMGIVRDAECRFAYVAAMATGRLHRIDMHERTVSATLPVGPWPRALALSPDGGTLLATRFISDDAGGVVYRVDTATFDRVVPIPLAPDVEGLDNSTSGRGLPNALMAVAFTPDGRTAWVGGKKDNIFRGGARDGRPLTFETTTRSMIAVIDVAAGVEAAEGRIDIDDHELVSHITFSPGGALAYVLHRGNREVSVYDASTFQVIDRLQMGHAPIGAALAPDGRRLWVHSFLSRQLELVELLGPGADLADPLRRLAVHSTADEEPLRPAVLRGKRLFYAASDPRISRDGYLSCASCHLDDGHDGRVWDFTDRGEGLRNTTSLRGRAGVAHGPLHWTANFDELQDFEHDIRSAFGGTGLMSDAAFAATSDPLGPPKAGRSRALDDLAAYVASLDTVGISPGRRADGGMTALAARGRQVFAEQSCARCHGGDAFTDSPAGRRHDVGTIGPGSGRRLGGDLDGIDTPTLRGLWRSAPYLHDGSAPTLHALFRERSHGVTRLDAPDRAALVAYLLQIDDLEGAPASTPGR